MSFGYAVGDVIAVLGLFERVAIELRSYKNAPTQFQQLGAEIDLLRSTLQHVLALNADDPTERQTLEWIRAITMHCLQPLQALADKMQTKEPSLGHFRSTRSLKVIGTRLHWSLIAQKDVDELRKTILSELLAVNILLSVQQLGRIKQLSTHIRDSNSQLSTTIDARSRTIISQTSLILSLVNGMPGAITDLQSTTIAQAQQQAKRIETLDQRLSSTTAQLADLSIEASKTSAIIETYARSMRGAARRLSSYMEDVKKLIVFQILLGIASQMKRIVKAIEAIPLHLGLDIIRFDDALGESWGLPFQACGSWESFRTLLQSVVFATDRPGAGRVEAEKFLVMIASTGRIIDCSNWEKLIKAGLHIEQTMIVDSADCGSIDVCLNPICDGIVLQERGQRQSKHCPDCGRSVISRKSTEPMAVLPQRNRVLWEEEADVGSEWNSWTRRNESLPMPLRPFGPTRREPWQRKGISDEVRHFHRIQLCEPSQKFDGIEEALDKRQYEQDYSASHYMGFCCLQCIEDKILWGGIYREKHADLSVPISYLNEAISYDPWNAEAAYLLGRAYMHEGSFVKAHQALQDSLNWSKSVPSPAHWNTIGILYYEMNQFSDSFDALTRSLRDNPYVWEVWYNMGILHRATNSILSDAIYAFERALKLKPALLIVEDRLEGLKNHHDSLSDVPENYMIQGMCEIPLQDREINM